MRTLVVYCHPDPASFCAALRDTVVRAQAAAGHEVRVLDLYAIGFDPVMSLEERRGYHDEAVNVAPVETHVEHIRWAESLIFVYPTWWYGLPAMLKGWLDRVFVPGVAFLMPQAEGETVRPNMRRVRKVAAISTCGASWWLTRLVGNPGRKTLLRGIRTISHPRTRTLWMAHYLMDSSTPGSRAAYLAKVEARLRRF